MFLFLPCFVRSERIGVGSNRNHTTEFFVNPIGSINFFVSSNNTPMFAQSSCFVRKERIST